MQIAAAFLQVVGEDRLETEPSGIEDALFSRSPDVGARHLCQRRSDSRPAGRSKSRPVIGHGDMERAPIGALSMSSAVFGSGGGDLAGVAGR